MRNKYLIIPILLVASFSLTSCNNNAPHEEQEVTRIDKIVLNASDVELGIGDYFKLTISYSDSVDATEVTYKSNNEDVVSVDGTGLVYANAEGKAEVEVKKGNATARCKFTVSFAGEIPYIEIDGIINNHLEIDITTSYTFNAQAKFGAQLYDIDNPTYEVINEDGEGYFEGNIFHPTKKGNVTIKIGGSYKEFQMHNYYASLLIKEAVMFTVKEYSSDQREFNEINLFTLNEYKGNTFKTTFKPLMSLFVDGEDKSDELIYEFDENGVISYDSSENVISSIKSGEASLTLRYQGYSKIFPIYVNYLKDEYIGEEIIIDASIGEFPTSNIFSEFVGDQNIIKATSIDEKEIYEVEDGKVLGIKSHNFAEQKIILYNNVIGFIVSFKAYAKILKEAADLEEFIIYFGDDDSARGKVQNFQNDGYYVLNNDIDCSGYVYHDQTRMLGMSPTQIDQTCGFVGTFDGRGHAIKNLNTPKGGLFLIIGNKAVIRNVAFVDAILNTNGGNNDRFVLATYCYGARLSDIFINSSSNFATVNNALVAASITSACTIYNCVFEYTGTVTASRNYGSLMHVNEDSSPAFNNCYLISDTPMTMNSNGANKKYYSDTHRYADLDELGFEFKQYLNIKHYFDYAEMSVNANDFSSFNNLYWEVNSGIIKWKN